MNVHGHVLIGLHTAMKIGRNIVTVLKPLPGKLKTTAEALVTIVKVSIVLYHRKTILKISANNSP